MRLKDSAGVASREAVRETIGTYNAVVRCTHPTRNGTVELKTGTLFAALQAKYELRPQKVV